jgi:hypothetical protein
MPLRGDVIEIRTRAFRDVWLLRTVLGRPDGGMIMISDGDHCAYVSPNGGDWRWPHKSAVSVGPLTGAKPKPCDKCGLDALTLVLGLVDELITLATDEKDARAAERLRALREKLDNAAGAARIASGTDRSAFP